MMSNGIQANSVAIDWTISDKLNVRTTTRQSWEGDFNKNHSTIADKIAESIAVEAFSKLNQDLSNAYKPLPTSSTPLEMPFSLEIGRHGKIIDIKKWAQEAAELSPFKEWFNTFSNEKNNHVEYQTSSKFFSENSDQLEISYFQNKMSEIGKLVEKKVQSKLATFAQHPKNSGFKYKVEWYRKAERYTASMFDSRDNRLFIKMWIG